MLSLSNESNCNILGFCVVMAQAPVVGVHFIDDIAISLTIHNP